MKTLKQWKKYYKDLYPNQSDSNINQLAQKAFEDQQARTATTTNEFPQFGNGTNDTTQRGVILGFGLTDANGNPLVKAPSALPSFMQELLLTDPKTYRQIQTAVFQGFGKKISDPNTLGTYLQAMGQNQLTAIRTNPALANTSVEMVLNAGAANRASNPLFGQGGGANIPTRQIYKKTKEEVDAEINKIAQEKAGRDITPEDMQQQWYKDLRKGIRGLYNLGIVTKTSKKVNPTTGKLETVVEQVPQYSTEQITSRIGSAIEAADPESVARKQRLDGIKWLYSMGGMQR